MAQHNEVGKEGEEIAALWLVQNGFQLLHRNWRYSYFEIDIIAKKNNTLHIVEVKMRQGDYFGNPEDSVTRKKFRKLQRAADQFLFLYPIYSWIQYDIVAITMKKGVPQIFFIQDFYL